MAQSVQVSRPAPAGYVRALRNPLYDTDDLQNAATTQVRLFQVPLGQNNASAVRKTEADTNLTQAGQLANPQMFDLHGFQFETVPGALIANLILIYQRGVFEFSFGTQRIWLQVPISRVPQGPSLQAAGNAAAAAVTLNWGFPSVREYYPFVQPDGSPYPIKATETFQVRIFWPSLAITSTAVLMIRTFLVGTLYVGL
jgi:hypothetical protein